MPEEIRMLQELIAIEEMLLRFATCMSCVSVTCGPVDP
jgi:hypothetical protein